MTVAIIKRLQMNATKMIITSESEWAFKFWNTVLNKLIDKYGDMRDEVDNDSIH